MRHIFDFYWDHLRADLLSIEWSAGTVNPSSGVAWTKRKRSEIKIDFLFQNIRKKNSQVFLTHKVF